MSGILGMKLNLIAIACVLLSASIGCSDLRRAEINMMLATANFQEKSIEKSGSSYVDVTKRGRGTRIGEVARDRMGFLTITGKWSPYTPYKDSQANGPTGIGGPPLNGKPRFCAMYMVRDMRTGSESAWRAYPGSSRRIIGAGARSANGYSIWVKVNDKLYGDNTVPATGALHATVDGG